MGDSYLLVGKTQNKNKNDNNVILTILKKFNILGKLKKQTVARHPK